MRARDKSAPRQRHNPALVPGGIERKDEVDHRQAGTDEQCVAAACGEIAHRCAASAPHGLRMKRSPTPRRPERLGFLVADCETSASASTDEPSIKLDPPAALLANGADAPSLRRSRCSRSPPPGRDVAEIAREETPLSETAPVAAFRFKSPGEMVGVAGNRAHSLGANVEQMRRLGRRISDAAPDPAAAVDEERTDAAARKLHGEDRSRSAATDNRDRVNRSDLVVRPSLRIRRAGFALVIWSYMSVNGLAGGLR